MHIPGELHTVNPVANDVYPIYKENTREYALLKTVNFGTVLMMEVGALMVGRIENVPLRGPCKTGKRKRKFRIWWFDGYTDDTEGTSTA